MNGWTEASLGEVCELYQPKTISSSELVEDGPFPVYGANGVIGKYDKFNHEDPQLLITCRGATCGAVNISQPKSWINGNAMVVKPRNKSIDVGFLKHLFIGGIDLSAVITGAAQPQITRQSLAPLKIRFPNPAEQQRLISILDQADALRAKRREALAQLDSLTQSIFIEMFGDPVANDRAWPFVAVSDFVAGFESGKSIVADDEDESQSPFRVLKISAVTSLEYKPEQSKAVPHDYTPPASHFVRKGDLLFSRANTTELIGATAYVNETPDNLLLPDKLWRFVWFEKPRAAPLYVRHLFQQVKFRQEIGQRASGTSGSMQNISQPKVLSIRVGNPPLALQQTFATRIESVEALKASHRAALQELDRLFGSLQHRAFAGEL